MKCECGNEFEGNFCPDCGRSANKTIKLEKENSGEKKSFLDKLEFITDKRTMLSAGAVVSGIYSLSAGYWFTAPLFFIGAVLFSPQMRKRHSAEVKLLSILGSVLLFLGICFGVLQEIMVEAVRDEIYSDYSYYEPTTNEDRYGDWSGN